ncbi:hypothetical protein NIES4071_63380 [Calothrix sp. NIES-4071]|nr:hypothetical protein NIES4071_63380 [Calothrix sp. NIES-4071]BAZ60641.1 hypothetical protein NIES4105_63330 [Calothrix sp. NIES-4105]
MKAYKKYITVEDPNHIILSGIPFKAGQRVEIIILASDQEKENLAEKLRLLLKETQALHQNNSLTDEEIAAEIEAYRRGD